MEITEDKSGLPTLFQEVRATCAGRPRSQAGLGKPERAEEPVQANEPPNTCTSDSPVDVTTAL